MKTIAIFIATLLTFLTPIKGLLIFMIIAILFDTISGIYVSVKLKGWKSFSSTKFFNIVVKSFFYLVTIVMAYLADVFICEGSILGIKLLLSKAMLVVWSYNEFSSVNENSMKLGNKSIWVIIKEMLGKFKDIKKDLNDIGETPIENDNYKDL